MCSFHKAFEDLHLALFKPNTGQCDKCRAYTLKQIDEDVYKNLIQEENAQKETTRKRQCLHTRPSGIAIVP